MVAARAARSAPSSQRSRKKQLDGKKSAVFCRWYFALRNKRHYMSWSRTLLCNAPRGDLPCGWSGVGSSNADTTYPWSSVATSRCVLMACPFTTRRDNFTSTVCLEKPLDILMCPQSGGCMLNRVMTYTSTYIPCHKPDQICLPLFNSAAKNKSWVEKYWVGGPSSSLPHSQVTPINITRGAKMILLARECRTEN
jgi:hypothetical protein